MSEVSMNTNPNPINSESQNDAIAKYLEAGGRLTPMLALNLFGCFRLAARIGELRKVGMNIHTDYIRVTNKTGRLVTIGEYRLIGAAE